MLHINIRDYSSVSGGGGGCGDIYFSDKSVFNSVIPSKYVRNSSKPSFLHFNLFQLKEILKFKGVINSNTVGGGIYTVFTKIRYNSDM